MKGRVWRWIVLLGLIGLLLLGAVLLGWDAGEGGFIGFPLFSHEAPGKPATGSEPRPVYQATPEVSAAKRVYRPGEAIEVLYGGMPGFDRDWITIVERNAPESRYGEWFYIRRQPQGKLRFRGLTPGEYEVRAYFDWPRGGYQVRARYPVRVEGESPGSVREPVEEAVERERPNCRAQARVLLEGESLRETSNETPRFWFRDEERGKEVKPSFYYQGGRLDLDHLEPGRKGVQTTLDLNRANPVNYPGDLYAWTGFTPLADQAPEFDIELQRIIHLRLPQDNGEVMAGWEKECEEKPVFGTPVEFAWEPLGEGVAYEVRIERLDCERNYNTAEVVLEQTISSNRLSVPLPASGPGEVYAFHLTARRAGKRVGLLITHGINGMGWDYRFRVR